MTRACTQNLYSLKWMTCNKILVCLVGTADMNYTKRSGDVINPLHISKLKGHLVNIVLVDLYCFPSDDLWANLILWFSEKHFASYSMSSKNKTTHAYLVHSMSGTVVCKGAFAVSLTLFQLDWANWEQLRATYILLSHLSFYMLCLSMYVLLFCLGVCIFCQVIWASLWWWDKV